MGPWRSWIFPWLSLVYLTFIWGIPTLSCLVLVEDGEKYQKLLLLLSPLVWTAIFIVAAGTLSIAHQPAIVAGKFRRDVADPLYFHRRLYGLCWTSVYYNKPAYFLCLSIPLLKRLAFRLFGYRGSMSFTVYPDTWIRDLPLLHFEKGVYVSNRVTLGSNVVLSNGSLLVEGITLGPNSLVGHLSMLAPGVELAAGAEVGVGCEVGIRSKLGREAFVGPSSTIEHSVRLGAMTKIGCHSYIGSGSTIDDGAQIPCASVIASRTRIPGITRAVGDCKGEVLENDKNNRPR